MVKQNLEQKGERVSLIGAGFFLIIFFILAYIPPIPLGFGVYFYIVEQTVQYLLRSFLFIVIFVMIQAGLFFLYYKLGKFAVDYAPKLRKIPTKIEKLASKIVK